jgi:prepilin-type N-terminal cleavage/methylation domain-containing protein
MGRDGQGGFTLLEMLFVLVLTVLLLGLGGLGLRQMETALAPRVLARQVASTLRLGRAQAVAGNREMRVKLLPAGEAPGGRPVLWPQQGNLSRGSTLWEDRQGHKVEFPATLAMGLSQDCEIEAAPGYISFNPDGSSNALYVCILAEDDGRHLRKRYAVGVSHAATGRVCVLKWNQATSRFE